MQKFKNRWEIKENWQFLFPILGLAGLIVSSYLISSRLTNGILHLNPSNESYLLAISLLTLFLFIPLLGGTLKLFDVLEKKWKVDYRWELIAIFMAFAVTGSTAAKISAPLLHLLGLNSDTTSGWVYWPLRIFLIFPIYQVLLLMVGWIFGQFKFFWSFEKKMLRRMGFSRFIKD